MFYCSNVIVLCCYLLVDSITSTILLMSNVSDADMLSNPLWPVTLEDAKFLAFTYPESFIPIKLPDVVDFLANIKLLIVSLSVSLFLRLSLLSCSILIVNFLISSLALFKSAFSFYYFF